MDQTVLWQVVPRQVFIPYDCLLISVAFVVLCRAGCLWVTGGSLVYAFIYLCTISIQIAVFFFFFFFFFLFLGESGLFIPILYLCTISIQIAVAFFSFCGSLVYSFIYHSYTHVSIPYKLLVWGIFCKQNLHCLPPMSFVWDGIHKWVK